MTVNCSQVHAAYVWGQTRIQFFIEVCFICDWTVKHSEQNKKFVTIALVTFHDGIPAIQFNHAICSGVDTRITLNTVSGGSRNLFWRAKPSSPIESWGKRRKARFGWELRAEPEPRAKPVKNGKEGGSSVNPSPIFFLKIELEMVNFGAYVRQTLFLCTGNFHSVYTSYVLWFVPVSSIQTTHSFTLLFVALHSHICADVP